MKKALTTAIILTIFLSTCSLLANAQAVSLIAKESTWTYLDNGSDQGTTWKDSGFASTGWSSGQGPLGMGGITGATMNTTITKEITTYFICEVSVTGHTNGTLDFNVMCDDGFVLYINGKEAMRDNLGTGTITHTSTASSTVGGSDEGDYDPYSALDTFLVEGINVFAVELHNQSASSSDLAFDLEVTATELVDSSRYMFFRQGSWNYLDNGSNLGTSWIDSGYNDASWSSGDAVLGYGTLDGASITTTLSYGASSSNKYPTTYFRKEVTLTSPSYNRLQINLLADDAAAVYINGKLALSDGMPSSWDYLSYASVTAGGSDEGDYDTYIIPDSFLIDGVNTFAVEMHQVNATSSDLGFDMEIFGLLGSVVSGEIFLDMDGNGVRSVYDVFGSGAVEIKAYNDKDSNGIYLDSEEIGSVLTDPYGNYDLFVDESVRHLAVRLMTEDMDDLVEYTTDTLLTYTIPSGSTNTIFANFGTLGPRSMCLYIADNNDEDDKYYIANRITGKNKYISTLDVNEIEALAIRIGMDSAWACDAGQFGTINIQTGAFTAVGSGVGTGSGLIGGITTSISFTDIDGMAYDGVNHILYGTHKTGGTGNNDVLIAINRTTGAYIPDFFGAGIDYVEITGTNIKEDVDDIAFNPTTNQLLAINMQGTGDSTRYITIDPATGASTVISIIGIGDFESLGYYNTGELYGTTGTVNKTGYPGNSFYKIEKSTGLGTKLDTLAHGALDVEACDCLTGPTTNMITGSVFYDADSSGTYDKNIDSTYGNIKIYLYNDVNDNDTIDAGDLRIDSTFTDRATGFYVFSVDSSGNFLSTPVIDFTILATMNVTTDSSLTEIEFFEFLGMFDGKNDFGFHQSSGTPYLPVDWVSIDAEWTENKNAAVTWTTASESNSSHFEVERKIDGGSFVYVGRVEAAGNTNSFSDYSFVDFEAGFLPTLDIIYRVKQVDYDQQYEFSNQVLLTTNKPLEVMVYPNPVGDHLNVQVLKKGDYTITLSDMSGTVISTKSGTSYGNNTPIKIGDLNHLARGIYILHISSNGEDKVVKILK